MTNPPVWYTRMDFAIQAITAFCLLCAQFAHSQQPFGIQGQSVSDPLSEAEAELFELADNNCAAARYFAQRYAERCPASDARYCQALGQLLKGLSAGLGHFGDAAKAKELLRATSRTAETASFWDISARANIGLAKEFTNANRPDSAILFLQKAESQLRKKYSPMIYVEMQKTYGMAYHAVRDSGKAFQHLRMGLSELYELPPTRMSLRNQARYFHNMGIIYNQQGDLVNAADYFQRALIIRQREGFHREIPINLGVLAKVLGELGQASQAQKYFEMAERLSRDSCQAGFRLSILTAYSEFINNQGDPAKALPIAQEMERLARKMNVLSTQQHAITVQYQAHAALGNYRDAFHLAILSRKFDDSMHQVSFTQKVSEMEAGQAQMAQELEVSALNYTLQKRYDDLKILWLATGSILLVLLLAILFTITRIRANRKLKQQAVALANANATKQKLFSIIAHDLRSPLNSLRTLMDNERRFRQAGHNVDALMLHLQQKVTDTRLLLDNLLLWATHEKQELLARLAPTQLWEILEDERQLLQEDALLHGTTIRFEAESRPSVPADANMIRFVVRNLVSNALKFTPAGGWVKVSLGKAETSGFVRVSVQDTGPGFSPEALQKLRSPIEKAVPGDDLGHGLGLLLSRTFLAQHGSELHIESSLGQGATLWFDLPELSGQ